jgi:monoamine oxidase
VADGVLGHGRMSPGWAAEAGADVRIVVVGAGFAGLLAADLAERLGASVWLRCPVRSVEHDHQGVRVLTDDGEVAGV